MSVVIGMVRPLWFTELLKKLFPYRFVLAKLTRVPVIGRILDNMLFKGDEIYYLPKADVIEINKKVERPEDMVLPYQVAEYFVEKASYIFAMNFCICRLSSNCKNYPINIGCLFLGEAAKQIDPRFGRPITKREALEHLRKAREAGLVHLIGRDKIDSVWLDAKPPSKLLTICNCCPCCCLWKIIPHLSTKIAERIKKMPGVNVKIDYSKCVGCGICADGICFVDAIHMINGKPVITEDCRGCGRCVEVCPQGAIKIIIENRNFLDETIKRISSVVDVT